MTPPSDPGRPAERRLLAEPPHTAVLIGMILLLTALAGAWLQRRPGPGA